MQHTAHHERSHSHSSSDREHHEKKQLVNPNNHDQHVIPVEKKRHHEEHHIVPVDNRKKQHFETDRNKVQVQYNHGVIHEDSYNRCMVLLALLFTLAGIILTIIGAVIDRINKGKAKALDSGNCKYYCGWRELERSCKLAGENDVDQREYKIEDLEEVGRTWIGFIIVGVFTAIIALCIGIIPSCGVKLAHHIKKWLLTGLLLFATICLAISLLVTTIDSDSCYKRDHVKVYTESIDFNIGISWYIVLGAACSMTIATLLASQITS